MGKNPKVRYRLPVTEIVVAGKTRRKVDKVDGESDLTKAPVELISATCSVVTRGDEHEYVLAPPRGWLRSYKGAFQVNPDGRLVKTSAESTGELGTALKSIASIAGTVMAVAALAGEGEVVQASPIERALGATAKEVDAYKKGCPREHERAVQLADLKTQVDASVLTELAATVADPKARPRLDAARSLERALASQLAPIVTHYRTWRAAQITTVEDSFQFRVPIADIPSVVPPEVDDPAKAWAGPATIKSTSPPNDLKSLWEQFGTGIRAQWAQPRPANPWVVASAKAKPGDSTPKAPGEDEIVVRRPEIVDLEVIEQQKGVSVVTTRSRHFVADEYSEHVAYLLQRSRWGKRSLDLTFNDDGFLTGLGLEGAAALSGALQSASELTSSFGGGVEAATKAASGLVTARQASAVAELGRLKNEVETRQQRMLLAGLDATDADAVRLQRLQQLQGILEAQTAVAGADPGLVADLMSSTSDDLSWYEPPEPPAEAKPQIVYLSFDTPGEAVDENGAAANDADDNPGAEDREPPDVPLGGQR